MNTMSPDCCPPSEIIQHLHRRLEDLWLDETYLKYFETISCYTDLKNETVANFSEEIAALTQRSFQIKSAFDNWTSLPQEDRLSLMQTYGRLFQPQLKVLSEVQITFVFCRIFLAEFILPLCRLAPVAK
jgi:hypothetical protein